MHARIAENVLNLKKEILNTLIASIEKKTLKKFANTNYAFIQSELRLPEQKTTEMEAVNRQ